MAQGKVKWFDNKKGFGFIERTDGVVEDVFVHHSSIQGKGFHSLNTADEVSFDVTNSDQGLKAVNVRVTNPAPLGAPHR